jgi:hypothetical protein
MQFYVPKRPSVRNQMIYEEVVNEGLPQVNVATTWGVSQSQISRICTQVRRWLVRSRSVDDSLKPDEALWLANRTYVSQLRLAQRKAIKAFDEGLETHVEHTNTGDDRTVIKKRPGQGDPRLLTVYVKTAKDLRDAQVEEATSAHACAVKLADAQPWCEDRMTVGATQMVQDATAVLKRAARRGFAVPPIPSFSRAEFQSHVRQQFRATPDVSAVELLPPAWQDVLQQLYLEPAAVALAAPPLQQECEGSAYKLAEKAALCISAPANAQDVSGSVNTSSMIASGRKSSVNMAQKTVHRTSA